MDAIEQFSEFYQETMENLVIRAERIPCNFVSHHSPYLMSGPFEVWRTAMPNVGVHVECFHTFFRDEMMQARGHIGKDG